MQTLVKLKTNIGRNVYIKNIKITLLLCLELFIIFECYYHLGAYSNNLIRSTSLLL